MKIIRVAGSGEVGPIAEDQAPQPQPGSGELLVRVCAAGVTPSELLWYPTTHTKAGGIRSRAVPVHEFSGVIAAAGNEVTGFKAGQAIYGLNDWFADGALAEYCITQPSFVAPKPQRLTHVEAASVPIGALTAWQGLFERAQLQAGERVLVHGGSGSVGAFAVQLARHRGSHVIATASAGNIDFVKGLGAGQVIDYRTARFEEVARNMDVVFDTVGGDILQRSWGVLGPHGRMVTVAANGEGATDDRTKQAFFIVEPNQGQLKEIGDLLDSGRLQPVVDAVLPFSEARAAYSGAIKHGRGKLVIVVHAQESGAA